jgi:hypothetical protein
VKTDYKPDWVMLGVPRAPGMGVRLYACKELPSADFQITEAGFEAAWALDVTMKNVLVIDKPTYGEAIARLFEIWQPGSERPAIEGKRALPAGSGRTDAGPAQGGVTLGPLPVPAPAGTEGNPVTQP